MWVGLKRATPVSCWSLFLWFNFVCQLRSGCVHVLGSCSITRWYEISILHECTFILFPSAKRFRTKLLNCISTCTASLGDVHGLEVNVYIFIRDVQVLGVCDCTFASSLGDVQVFAVWESTCTSLFGDVQVLGAWESTCASSLGDVHVLGSTCTSSLTDVHVLWVHVYILIRRCARSGSPRVHPQ